MHIISTLQHIPFLRKWWQAEIIQGRVLDQPQSNVEKENTLPAFNLYYFSGEFRFFYNEDVFFPSFSHKKVSLWNGFQFTAIWAMHNFPQLWQIKIATVWVWITPIGCVCLKKKRKQANSFTIGWLVLCVFDCQSKKITLNWIFVVFSTFKLQHVIVSNVHVHVHGVHLVCSLYMASKASVFQHSLNN